MTKKQETALFGPEDHEAPIQAHGTSDIEYLTALSALARLQGFPEGVCRMVKAAPELLESLREMLPIVHDAMNADDDDVIGKIAYRASAAIAKAEGR